MRPKLHLDYVLRRKDGYPHPFYPTAPAVAWPTAHDESYVEFMESGFGEIRHTRRLILHEKAHFMWANIFDDELRDDWTALGGWYQEDGEWFTDESTTNEPQRKRNRRPALPQYDKYYGETIRTYV